MRRRIHKWGDWDIAAGPHHAALARLRETYAPRSSVLDLGCGTGLMLAHLPPETPYLGIDVQSRAIDVARQSCRGDHQRVHCADLSSIVLAESFGCILFSEVLYYQPTVTAAMHLLARYVPFVKKDGIVLVSIFIDPNKPERINGPIWQAIHYEYGSQLIASDAVPTRDGQSHWRIVALKF